MKKTIIAMLALAGVAFGATTIDYSMSDLVKKGTLTGTVTDLSDSYVNSTVYSFNGESAITGITDSDLSKYITDGSGYLTIAAWINAESVAEASVFSFGAHGNGIKFSIKENKMQFTAKGVWDYSYVGSTGIATDQWTLVAWSLDLSKSGSSTAFVGNATGTANVTAWNTPEPFTFAISSGNSDLTSGPAAGATHGVSTNGVRDGFNGEIANLVVFSSDSVATYDDITAKVGAAAPVAIPEPTTATLSLLALAGLAARRRRK